MGPLIFVGIVIVVLVAGTYVLQGLILLAALAWQLLVWIVWGAMTIVSALFLAVTDRAALARMWRDADPARQPAG
jgi:hypothetical protein